MSKRMTGKQDQEEVKDSTMGYRATA